MQATLQTKVLPTSEGAPIAIQVKKAKHELNLKQEVAPKGEDGIKEQAFGFISDPRKSTAHNTTIILSQRPCWLICSSPSNLACHNLCTILVQPPPASDPYSEAADYYDRSDRPNWL